MEKYIDKIFSLKKFPGQLVFVIWISSLLLVVLPKSMLNKFMLAEFKANYGQYIGPVFLFSSAISLWMVGKLIIDKIKQNKYVNQRQKEIIECLNNLNFNEIVVLREFVIQSKNTIKAPMNDETVIALENAGVIYKATTSAIVSGLDMAFPYSISTFVRDRLTHENLDLPPDEEITNNPNLKQKILNERPQWAINIANREALFNKYVY